MIRSLFHYEVDCVNFESLLINNSVKKVDLQHIDTEEYDFDADTVTQLNI
ncbi:MAG: hypothetical protein JKY33_05760 [Bacteroidia bacterium]|nr:hypothetical protein [Bacteroidia bacterium]